MIEYEVSAKARILILANKWIKRFKPNPSFAERLGISQFMSWFNDLPESVCKELLEEAHQA